MVAVGVCNDNGGGGCSCGCGSTCGLVVFTTAEGGPMVGINLASCKDCRIRKFHGNVLASDASSSGSKRMTSVCLFFATTMFHRDVVVCIFLIETNGIALCVAALLLWDEEEGAVEVEKESRWTVSGRCHPASTEAAWMVMGDTVLMTFRVVASPVGLERRVGARPSIERMHEVATAVTVSMRCIRVRGRNNIVLLLLLVAVVSREGGKGGVSLLSLFSEDHGDGDDDGWHLGKDRYFGVCT